MNFNKFIIFSFLFLRTLFFSGCASSQELVKFEEVKLGLHLDKAKEIDLDTFLVIWTSKTKNPKRPTNLEELYKDSLCTYFGIPVSKKLEFYKVNNDRLKIVDYKSIDGEDIRNNFYEKIIPLEDKDNLKKCTSRTHDIEYKYRFIESENSIEIDCHFKVLCEWVIKTINNDYKAMYNIGTKTLIKIN